MNITLLRAFSIVFLILAACIYIYTNKQQQYYHTRALPAAKELLLEVSNWEKQTLIKHLSTQARQTINDQQLEKLLHHYRQFGTLQSFEELHFSHLTSALSILGTKYINYRGTVQFDSGPAQLNLTLLEKKSAETTYYTIYNFTLRR